jgi:CRP/FNR family cyclic AMP-dependent transcriptional regulator
MAWIDSHKDRRIATLKRVNLLLGCNERDLRQIASLTTETDVPAGRILAREGEFGSEFYIIVEGRAIASRHGQMIATLVPTRCFVEPALLDRGKRITTITAETDLHLFVFSRREFTGLCSSFPAVERRMGKADDLVDFMTDGHKHVALHGAPRQTLDGEPVSNTYRSLRVG